MSDERKITDLTKPVDSDLEIYYHGDYSDPEFSAETWCTVESQGYWVSKLILGTQTGTHIDAPAHFKSGAETLEDLPIERLMGPYFLINLDDVHPDLPPPSLVEEFERQQILFLKSSSGEASLTSHQMAELVSLKIPVWAVDGVVEILEEPSLSFHRRLAEAGIYLIENLHREACQAVQPGGDLIALPLRLQGVSGSPCRVLVVE